MDQVPGGCFCTAPLFNTELENLPEILDTIGLLDEYPLLMLSFIDKYFLDYIILFIYIMNHLYIITL